MIDNIIFRGYDVIGSVSNLENDYIKIFPNPTNDYFEFKSVNEKIEDYSFRIVDINGRLIKNISVINQKVDISDLGSGTYIIKLQKENRIITGKVVKF